MRWSEVGLDAAQVAVVRSVVPDAEVVSDDSWGLLDTRVLHVRGRDGDRTVKASGPDNTHFARELAAHRRWTADLAATGHTGALVAADERHRVLVLDRVPGHLALGTPDEHDPEVHRQAGAILRRFHDQHAEPDTDFLARQQAKALGALDQPHGIAPEVVERARTALLADEPGPVVLVPTHGDWHARNWIVDRGRVAAIDFGRFALRPRESDLTRVAVNHWEQDPELERAFLDGYGGDPRTPRAWRSLQLREAVGTAVWAYTIGDPVFEAQGHRMLDDALRAIDEADLLR